MKILDTNVVECSNCGGLVDYKDEDIQHMTEFHDESSKIYSYRIEYVECEYCENKIILEKLRLSPDS